MYGDDANRLLSEENHTNDQCEVTESLSGSEARGQDLRVTNDEVEGSKG